MSRSQFRYHPDEWAHDLDQWWVPLASLVAAADCDSDGWANVLGVEEFFDHRLLEQARVLTPWICLAATAVTARAARDWAETAARQGPGTDASAASCALATTAFDLAVSLQALRWNGARFGAGPISTEGLIDKGRRALAARGHPVVQDARSAAVHLVAGWLAHSHSAVPAPPGESRTLPVRSWRGEPTADSAIAKIANAGAGSDPLAWGTAHLAERLLDGVLDRRQQPLRPDEPPVESQATVLLAAGKGQVGLVEARRHRSLLEAEAGIVVPDLARMAFAHGNADFLDSIAAAFAAAGKAGQLDRPGELISWNIQLSGGTHPLAERTVSGRSAGLGTYVAFRSLSNLGVFADKDVAFTGQISPDGRVGQVQGASDKIEAAHHRRIRLIVYPKGQTWRDPDVSVQFEGVETGEDALIAAAQQLRGLRSYLEAACGLVAPEPWLRTWLRKQGRHGDEMPLLTVVCRHLPPAHEATPDRGAPPPAPPGPPGVTGSPGFARNDAVRNEPDISPCPAHLLASTYPSYSFTISADAGGGNTMAAKRMVAEAARQALSGLRALGEEDRLPGFNLPLYLPLGDVPPSWDALVQASVAALPGLSEPGLEIAAAVASALRADAPRTWQPLVVADGTDRTGRGNSDPSGEKERSFVALVTGRPHPGQQGWQPRRPPQVVLCGRTGSPAHRRAAEALRRERPDSTVTMALDPLGAREIDRYVKSLSDKPITLTGRARDLAANPLFLTLSVIAGQPRAGEGDSTNLLDRVIDVLLGEEAGHRRFLAEIAFRAAVAKGQPAGEFTLTDIATGSAAAVELALREKDIQRAMAVALDLDERRSFQSAEEDTHLLTASGGGWRFFHDRIFAFLVADRIARHALENHGSDDDAFGALDPHLGDPLWTDVIEATGRLLELRSRAPASPG